MSVRACFDRILRDDGDDSGQTVRQWRITAEPGHIVIRDSAGDGGRYFLGMRPADVELFITDLRRAVDFSLLPAVSTLSPSPASDTVPAPERSGG